MLHREFDLSTADVVGIPNIGDFKVVASDTFYDVKTEITIDVLGKLEVLYSDKLKSPMSMRLF